MSDEQDIDRQLEKSGGGSINNYDPRLSRGLAVFVGALSIIAVASIGWVATSINTLNINVARMVERIDSKDKRDDVQDVRISRNEDLVRDLSGDVKTLEGKAMRSLQKGEEPFDGR